MNSFKSTVLDYIPALFVKYDATFLTKPINYISIL